MSGEDATKLIINNNANEFSYACFAFESNDIFLPAYIFVFNIGASGTLSGYKIGEDGYLYKTNDLKILEGSRASNLF